MINLHLSQQVFLFLTNQVNRCEIGAEIEIKSQQNEHLVQNRCHCVMNNCILKTNKYGAHVQTLFTKRVQVLSGKMQDFIYVITVQVILRLSCNRNLESFLGLP